MINPFNPAIYLISMYRVYSYLNRWLVTKPIAYFLYFITRIFFSSDIHPSCQIGKNFSIRHHFNIVIGKNVVIGDNCIIYNGVSIGQRNINDDAMPEIGSYVVIYKGATIVGNGVVRDNTVIRAHSLIIL